MSCTVLVVEDDRDLRETVADVLRDEGYAVEEAADGQVALEKLQSGLRPCLVLLDLMMPVLSGWEVIARLQEKELRVPLCVVSAAAERAPSHVGCVLKKPIEMQHLLDVVAQHCGGSCA